MTSGRLDQRLIAWTASHRWEAAIAVVAAASLCLKLVIAWNTYGTNDVLYWETFLRVAREKGGVGLYHDVWYFNHPPFMITVLYVLGFLADATGTAFRFWLKLPAILADVASLYLVWKILCSKHRMHPAPLVLMACAPSSILVSGFHGNTDPLMTCLVLLSVHWLVEGRPWWMAGVAMGMATNIKIVPLIYAPVLFFFLPDRAARGRYFGALLLTFVVGSLPYVLGDPEFIFARVLGYGSLYGQWGLSRLLASSLPARGAWIGVLYAGYGKFLVLLVIGAVAWWMNSKGRRPPLFHQLGFTTFLFLSLTPGFGIQYLAWPVPWVTSLGVARTLVYSVTSGLFQFMVYDFWSGSFPWYLANSDKVGSWRGPIVYYELLTWAAVVALTWSYGARLKSAGA